jgi:hypothetical protein
MEAAAATSVWSCNHLRAYGHRGTTVSPGFEARSIAACTSRAPMPWAPEERRHLGVSEDQPVPVDPADELSLLAVLGEEEPVVFTVIEHFGHARPLWGRYRPLPP